MVNSSLFLDMGTKFRPLLRTDFSAFESGKFSGIVSRVTTVFWNCDCRVCLFFISSLLLQQQPNLQQMNVLVENTMTFSLFILETSNVNCNNDNMEILGET